MNQEKKIFFGVEGKRNGCNWYRVKQPFNSLSQREDVIAASSSMLEIEAHKAEWIARADVLVNQMATSENYIEFILKNQGKKKFVLDMDDNYFCVSPYNPSYQHYGISDIKVNLTESDEQMTYLWKDGEHGFSIEENQKKLELFRSTIKAVDLVTTPSPVLAGVLKKIGAKKVEVMKNTIDLAMWSPLKLEKDEFIRIGYQGGWSHYEDWWVIHDAIVEIMNRHPNVLLVFMGQIYEGVLKGIDPKRIVNEGWVDIEAYPYRFKTLGVDIGIAPLANKFFNHCKSEIKWEEYGALKIPCVASNVPPYSLAINHGFDGFLANSTDDWVQSLTHLIKFAEARREIGENAQETVRRRYDCTAYVDKYVDIFSGLFNKVELVRV